MRKRIFLILLSAAMLTGCATGEDVSVEENSDHSQSEEMERSSVTDTITLESTYELRDGNSTQTISLPEDLPDVYDFGTGRASDWSSAAMNGRMPEPTENITVLNTVPNTSEVQVLYLWEEGNAPAVTEFTDDMTGYQTFIVDNRLRPYTPQEGALDVARAVRFIRKNADIYGIDPNDIAVMGYSAGGMQAGEFLMHYDEDVNGTALDADYVPDELDSILAHASADGMIYSFYGRLSFGSTDIEELKSGNLPPTFYCYGTEDPFYSQFEAQVKVMEEVGVSTTTIVLDGWPHGFGGDGDWVEDYATWLENVFAQND